MEDDMNGLRTKIGSNMSEIHYGRIQVMYSYETPVAGYHPNKGYFRTESYYSVTTSKHINKYLGGKNVGVKVSQEWINSLI
jgi:hypothetical protein